MESTEPDVLEAAFAEPTPFEKRIDELSRFSVKDIFSQQFESVFGDTATSVPPGLT